MKAVEEMSRTEQAGGALVLIGELSVRLLELVVSHC